MSRAGDERVRQDAPTSGEAREAVLALLAARARHATVCPSEVARRLAADRSQAADWRDRMAGVHEAVDALLSEGRVRLSWKAEPLVVRSGPYRIGRTDGG